MLNRLPSPTQMPSLSWLLDDIGGASAKQIARALHVSERSLYRWIKADQAPRPVMLALYWLTRWGMNAVHCEAHNAAVLHAGMATSLRRQIDRLEQDYCMQIERLQAQLEHLARIGDFGAANDPAETVCSPRPARTTAPVDAVTTAGQPHGSRRQLAASGGEDA